MGNATMELALAELEDAIMTGFLMYNYGRRFLVGVVDDYERLLPGPGTEFSIHHSIDSPEVCTCYSTLPRRYKYLIIASPHLVEPYLFRQRRQV